MKEDVQLPFDQSLDLTDPNGFGVCLFGTKCCDCFTIAVLIQLCQCLLAWFCYLQGVRHGIIARGLEDLEGSHHTSLVL